MTGDTRWPVVPGVKGRVLTVDDDPTMHLIVEAALRDRCHLAFATTGAGALEQVGSFNPEVVLLDVELPDASGIEVCRQITANRDTADALVIMVSARGDIEALARSFAAGAHDFVRKPFDFQELTVRIYNALQLRRSREEVRRRQERMEHDLALAGSLQRTMMSPWPVFTPTYDFGLASHPCSELGGDVFDVIECADGRICAYVGDVAGHGVGPALAATMVKAFLSELLTGRPHTSPAEVANLLEERFRGQIPNPELYLTLFLMILDPRSKSWRCLSCGHPEPVVFVGGERAYEARMLAAGAMPVGCTAGADLSFRTADEFVLPHEADMVLVLFSDGLVEAPHADTGEPCGREGVAREAARSLAVGCGYCLANRVLDGIANAGYQVGADDCSVLAMLVPPRALDLTLPVSLAPVRGAAQQVEEALTTAGWGQAVCQAAELVVVEALSNVVHHGRLAKRTSMHLRLRVYPEHCLLVVEDEGSSWDLGERLHRAQYVDETFVRGRGLMIIESIAEKLELFRRGNRNVMLIRLSRHWRMES